MNSSGFVVQYAGMAAPGAAPGTGRGLPRGGAKPPGNPAEPMMAPGGEVGVLGIRPRSRKQIDAWFGRLLAAIADQTAAVLERIELERSMETTRIREEREKLRVTGVSDVQSFDEEQVLLETGKGMLIVRGQGLHVEKLQLDAGETVVRGEISLLEYDDSVPPRGGVLRRLVGA